MMTIIKGTKAYLASDLRYYGPVTVDEVRPDGTLAVITRDGRRGKCAQDQLYLTAREAKEAATHHMIWHS